MPARRVSIASCPKQMTFGPCGGVRLDDGCEVDGRPCPFLDARSVPPPTAPRHRPRPVGLGRVLIDLRLPVSTEADSELVEIAGIFSDVGATALIGEHVDDPDDAAPHHHGERLAAVGIPAVVTVTGRDRSESEQAAEMIRLAETGVVAVHCVTGDHPSVRFGPEATATFVLDGTQLATIARSVGAVAVSVAESPAANPTARRPKRLATKQSAGADMAVLNHAGPPSRLVEFADRCRDHGGDLTLVAPVPVITDHRSARALSQFPGLVLPHGLVDRVLAAADPHRAGVAAAVEIGTELLASGRFATVNLSGAATAGGPVARAETMAEVATELASQVG